MNSSQFSSRTEALKTAGRYSRNAIKEIVREAVREEMEERDRESPSRSSPGSTRFRRMVLLGVGALIGALIARRMSSHTDGFSNKITSKVSTESEEPTVSDDREASEIEASEADGKSEAGEGTVDTETGAPGS